MSKFRFILATFLLSCVSPPDGFVATDGISTPDSGRQNDVGVTTADLVSADMRVPVDQGTADVGATMPPSGTTRYLQGPFVSPLTDSVLESMRTIHTNSAAPDDGVFIKVGASGTVNSANLTCFGATSSYQVDLAGRAALQPTIDRFANTTFAGQSSWDRTTLAAEVGRTASWVQSGAPSPLEQELAALNPRFALVNYGTNDMQQGITHGTALWPFYANMVSLLDELSKRGVIPIITGLNPRADTATAALWVPTYDAVTRALAESLQVPYLDLYTAVKDLPNRGLIADGIHGNSYFDGASQPCVFSSMGLQFNYNQRNLLTLELLDDVARTLLDGTAAPDQNARAWLGAGEPDDAFVVDVLPFSHHADTSDSTTSARNAYSDCDAGQDESGPEYYYALELTGTTALRIMVFDGINDIDIHLLDGETCLARDDKMIEGTFGPGEFTIVADTWVSQANGPLSGPFTLVVVECESGDPDCN